MPRGDNHLHVREKVIQLFLHAAPAMRSNSCQSARQLPGIQLAVVFPGEIVTLEKLSLAWEWISDVPPAELSDCTARAFTDGSSGEPWGNRNQGMNWMGSQSKRGEVRRGCWRNRKLVVFLYWYAIKTEFECSCVSSLRQQF